MLSIVGVGCNEYAGIVGRGGSVPDVVCPAPGCEGRRQRGHGFYARYVDGRLFELRWLIRRLDLHLNASRPRSPRSPKAQPPEKPTGISYLDLLARKHYGSDEGEG